MYQVEERNFRADVLQSRRNGYLSGFLRGGRRGDFDSWARNRAQPIVNHVAKFKVWWACKKFRSDQSTFGKARNLPQQLDKLLFHNASVPYTSKGRTNNLKVRRIYPGINRHILGAQAPESHSFQFVHQCT